MISMKDVSASILTHFVSRNNIIFICIVLYISLLLFFKVVSSDILTCCLHMSF